MKKLSFAVLAALPMALASVAQASGFDDNFALNGLDYANRSNSALRGLCRAHFEGTGVTNQIDTNRPSVRFETGYGYRSQRNLTGKDLRFND